MRSNRKKAVDKPVRLLNRVAGWYGKSLGEAGEAKKSLMFWGMADVQLWARFQIGFCNGTLAEIAPVDSEIYQELQAAGVLDKAGKEVLVGCVTVPRFNQYGDCMGICGWQVNDPEGRLIFIPGITEDLDVETARDLVELLLREAQVIVPISVETNLMEYLKTDSGFVLELGRVRYEAKGISKENLKLRVSLKATLKNKEKPIFLDAVDLYSHRSRKVFARGCADTLGEMEETVFEDLTKLIDLAEAWKPAGADKPLVAAMTEGEKQEALDFLNDPRLLDRVLEDFETCEYIGEEVNKVIGYLAAVSRKLDDPLAVLVQSRSAAGKSTLQDAVLKFVPKEDYEKYTRLTGQALFYKDEEGLVHKLLAIEEEVGSEDASYSLRNLQSAKSLTIATIGRDPETGKMKTMEYEVKGPVALMVTTTSVDMNYETANRFITLTIDESKEMTEKILVRQREADTLKGLESNHVREGVMKLHHNAQRLLRPLKVVNPYAEKLTFPSDSLRARRDHKKYLNLIKAIAFLHQFQREVKSFTPEGSKEPVSYIEVDKQDIETANRLARFIFSRTLDEVSAPSRLLLKEIKAMVKDKATDKSIEPKLCRFTRKDMREWCKWSDFQIKYHIKELVELEYLFVVHGKKGTEYVYELLDSNDGEGKIYHFSNLQESPAVYA